MASSVTSSTTQPAIKGLVYDLPLGSRDLSGKDGAGRIYRPGSFNGSCFYVAVERLRVCEYSPKEASGAALLKVDESYRSMIGGIKAHEDALPRAVNWLTASPDAFSKSLNKGNAPLFLADFKAKLAAIKAARGLDTSYCKDEDGLDAWIEVLDLFLAQDRFDSFEEYLFDLKLGKRGQIIVESLEALGLTREKIALQLATGASAEEGELITKAAAAFTGLPVEVWVSYAQQYAQNVYSNFFGLEYLSGKREDDIDQLIDLLASRGPMLVTGSLGFSFYAAEPKKLDEKYGLRQVYGWPVGSLKGKAIHFMHCVTLVGALKRETGKGYVYFLDPEDVSDPSDPVRERLFKISYATFRESLRSIQSNQGLSGKVPLAQVWNLSSLKGLVESKEVAADTAALKAAKDTASSGAGSSSGAR